MNNRKINTTQIMHQKRMTIKESKHNIKKLALNIAKSFQL
jgi:hypothetical protein